MTNDEEVPSEPDQRFNEDFENGDLTEEELRDRETQEGVETPVSELEQSDSYLLETAAERDGPKAFVHTEAGLPRDHQPYRESSEEKLFIEMLGFDYDRHQVDVPGSFELSLENGKVEIEYEVARKSDILADDKTASFLEYFVGEGLAETNESEIGEYEIQMTMGGDSYLSVEMTYDEASNRGRKKALEKMDMVNDLLAGQEE